MILVEFEHKKRLLINQKKRLLTNQKKKLLDKSKKKAVEPVLIIKKLLTLPWVPLKLMPRSRFGGLRDFSHFKIALHLNGKMLASHHL